jgi:ABC-type phosphate transport system substrate-binding protein
MSARLPKFILLAALIFLARRSLTAASGSSVVVVANASITVSAISQDEVREVFLGSRQSLSNGSKVTPVLLKGGPVHEAFLKSYLGKSTEGFRTWWLRYIFTGQGLLPKTLASEADLIDYVSRTEGALGYAAPASVRGNVKCIRVAPDHTGP